MSKIELVPISRDAGRKLWLQVFENCEYPRLSTKWFEARDGKRVIGWCCCRYRPSRPDSEAIVISEGLFVEPAYRGFGLQNEIRAAMVGRYRTSGSKRKILVQTYVNAENIASLKNAVRAGLVPYKTVREGTSVFVHLQGKL